MKPFAWWLDFVLEQVPALAAAAASASHSRLLSLSRPERLTPIIIEKVMLSIFSLPVHNLRPSTTVLAKWLPFVHLTSKP